MARPHCKVKLTRFKPDLSGYTQVKDGSGVQSILAGKAEAVRSSADSTSKGRHAVRHGRARFDMHYAVVAEDYEAKRDQAKRKTLTKALGRAGGGS